MHDSEANTYNVGVHVLEGTVMMIYTIFIYFSKLSKDKDYCLLNYLQAFSIEHLHAHFVSFSPPGGFRLLPN